MRWLLDIHSTSRLVRFWLALTLALIAVGARAQSLVFDCAQLDQFAREGSPIFPEEREWYARHCVEEEDDDDEEELGELIGARSVGAAETTGASPPLATCPALAGGVIVTTDSPHVQCRRLDAAGVGIPDLIAQGILDAVDVQGWVSAPMQICFPRSGRLVFLDSSTAPRTVSYLAAQQTNGLTCGSIDRVGTVVLLQGGEIPAGDAGESHAVPPSVPIEGAYLVYFCRVTTTDDLSLRAGPSVFYTRLGIIPKDTRLSATSRTSNWFLVEFGEQRGWVSADYVRASASCDIAGEAIETYLAIRAPGARTLTDCQLRAGDIINLRRGSGLEYDVLAEIPYRTNLIATERSGEWFQVEYNDIIGWVHIDYVFRNGACG